MAISLSDGDLECEARATTSPGSHNNHGNHLVLIDTGPGVGTTRDDGQQSLLSRAGKEMYLCPTIIQFLLRLIIMIIALLLSYRPAFAEG